MMVRGGNIALSIAFGMLFLSAPQAQAEATRAARIQTALETWITERAAAEKITGIAAYISFGAPGPAIEAFAGKVGAAPSI
jgi:D-alanyl-D-alanine carboxypeptidase